MKILVALLAVTASVLVHAQERYVDKTDFFGAPVYLNGA